MPPQTQGCPYPGLPADHTTSSGCGPATPTSSPAPVTTTGAVGTGLTGRAGFPSTLHPPTPGLPMPAHFSDSQALMGQ